jgi:hypothetical protein
MRQGDGVQGQLGLHDDTLSFPPHPPPKRKKIKKVICSFTFINTR